MATGTANSTTQCYLLAVYIKDGDVDNKVIRCNEPHFTLL